MIAVDLFAGLGGLTEGAKRAGVRVVWAGNHWRIAVDTHEANHPEVKHACQDLHQTNWLYVPRHDLLLAAPACTGHTPARGKDQPHHDPHRSTAWAVVSCVEVHRPAIVLVENVPAFTRWALYPAWCSAMRALGLTLSPHVIDAADYGIPQNRKRLFIIGTRSRHPLVLRPRVGARQPAFGPHIQWHHGDWRPIDNTLVVATRRRIENGRRQFGDRFVMPYYSNGSGLTGRSIDRPIGTITTVDRWGVVDGDRMRMLNVEECRAAMAFPSSYHLPAQSRVAKHMLGNAVPPPMVTEIIREIAA